MASRSKNNSSSHIKTTVSSTADIIDMTGSGDGTQSSEVGDISNVTPAGPDFHVDTTDMNLSAAELAEIEGRKARWNAMKTQRRKGPFRLMDLPAEIRLRVYGFALKEKAPKGIYNLTCFKMPAITRASKQLRTETLPAFFSENAFSVMVKSNFGDRHDYRNQYAPAMRIPQIQSDQKASGVTRMRRPVRDIIKNAGPAAVIRDITFQVISPRFIARPNDGFATSIVHFMVINGTVQSAIRDGPYHPSGMVSSLLVPWEKQDVDAALKAMTDKAQDIGRRLGFNGLTLQDIDDMARELRYLVPGRV